MYRHVLVLSVALAGVTACSPGPADPSSAYITGTIAERGFMASGVRRGDGVEHDSISRILVEEVPGGPCLRAAWLVVGDETSVQTRGGGRRHASDLEVGLRVSVWTEGPQLDSCPPIAGAARVVIER